MATTRLSGVAPPPCLRRRRRRRCHSCSCEVARRAAPRRTAPHDVMTNQSAMLIRWGVCLQRIEKAFCAHKKDGARSAAAAAALPQSQRLLLAARLLSSCAPRSSNEVSRTVVHDKKRGPWASWATRWLVFSLSPLFVGCLCSLCTLIKTAMLKNIQHVTNKDDYCSPDLTSCFVGSCANNSNTTDSPRNKTRAWLQLVKLAIKPRWFTLSVI